MNQIKRLLLGVALVVFCLSLNAQEKDLPEKKHFELVGTLPSPELQKAHDALNSYGLLDAYRFDDKRRTIPFVNIPLQVVLLSNKELSKPTGSNKRAALRSAPQGNDIRFALTAKGKLKVIATN